MKKIKSNLSLCISILLMCTMLTSCGLSEKDVVGTWGANYTYEGKEITAAFELYEDGTYYWISFKDGVQSRSEEGEYEVKFNKVILYNSDSYSYHGISTEFKHKNGSLANGDHEYTKIDIDL